MRPHHSNVLHLQSRRQRGGTADPGGVLGRCVLCSSSRPLELCLCIVPPRINSIIIITIIITIITIIIIVIIIIINVIIIIIIIVVVVVVIIMVIVIVIVVIIITKIPGRAWELLGTPGYP